MKEKLEALLKDKKLAILGFGREGKSTYQLIRSLFPERLLTIVDENDQVRNDIFLSNDPHIEFITGNGCMKYIDDFDFAFKSPGIPSNTLQKEYKRVILSSQTDIFLRFFGSQVIGITGTKGKSTTSSLIFHILKNAGKNSLLVGNIGIPPFDCINEIREDTIIVMELSSHQLEYINHAPHIGVLLNLFQEHLDHYYTYEEYKSAKFNIGKYQKSNDYFIFNKDNEAIVQLIGSSGVSHHKELAFSLNPGTNADVTFEDQRIIWRSEGEKVGLYNTAQGQPLIGHHNLYNIMAASVSCFLSGVSVADITSGIRSFNGLPHRIERIGVFGGVLWYNDSIATIPEATIEAIRTLIDVDTLILGGFDRGIDYSILYPFLNTSGVSNIIFVGNAGKRMMDEFSTFGVGSIRFHVATDYQQVIEMAGKVTQRGKICLLSPAAASYDMFKNFEDRGNTFKKNVRAIIPSHI